MLGRADAPLRDEPDRPTVRLSMSTTHNSIILREEQAASGDADEPGSSSDADGPPEPEAPGIDAHTDDGASRLQVIAPDPDSEDPSASTIDLEWIRVKLVDALECIDSAIARLSCGHQKRTMDFGLSQRADP